MWREKMQDDFWPVWDEWIENIWIMNFFFKSTLLKKQNFEWRDWLYTFLITKKLLIELNKAPGRKCSPKWNIVIKFFSRFSLQVGAQTARMKMTPVPLHGGFLWQAYNEETTAFEDSSFMMVGLLEQINATRDVSDYLWYMTEWVAQNLMPLTWIFTTSLSVVAYVNNAFNSNSLSPFFLK